MRLRLISLPNSLSKAVVVHTGIPVFLYCCRPWLTLLTLAGEGWRSCVRCGTRVLDLPRHYSTEDLFGSMLETHVTPLLLSVGSLIITEAMPFFDSRTASIQRPRRFLAPVACRPLSREPIHTPVIVVRLP